MSRVRPATKSFVYAFEGIREAIKSEPNFRFHLIVAVLAIILGKALNLHDFEWLILVITILLVLILELINTAIEAIVDLVSPEYNRKAKIAKDVSAAAVLFGVIAAVCVGAFLFLPKVLLLF